METALRGHRNDWSGERADIRSGGAQPSVQCLGAGKPVEKERRTRMAKNHGRSGPRRAGAAIVECPECVGRPGDVSS